MANYNSQYTGEQIDAAVGNSTKVVANPDISGTTPASLTSLEVAGTKYKVAADITVDSALSDVSENPVQNKVINSALNGKQATLVSGTNIKTVNNTSLLGGGDISGLEVTTNRVTSLSAASTDTQYPSAKCVYDIIGNIETLLAAI